MNNFSALKLTSYNYTYICLLYNYIVRNLSCSLRSHLKWTNPETEATPEQVMFREDVALA